MLNKTDRAKKLAKCYHKALFNKKMYGEYGLDELLGFSVENDEKTMEEFRKSVEMLQEYPAPNSRMLHGVMTDMYVSENRVSANEEAKKWNVTPQYIYIIITDACEIIGKRIFGGLKYES